MSEGRVLVDGAPEAVRSDPEVQRVYLGGGREALARAARGHGAGRADPAGRRPQYLLRQKPHPARRGARGARGRGGRAAWPQRRRQVLDDQEHHGHRAAAERAHPLSGQEIQGRTPEEIARLGIGLVPQGRRLFPNLTVDENLAMGSLRRRSGAGVHWDRERIFDVLSARARTSEQQGGRALGRRATDGRNRPLVGRQRQAVAARRAVRGARSRGHRGDLQDPRCAAGRTPDPDHRARPRSGPGARRSRRTCSIAARSRTRVRPSRCSPISTTASRCCGCELQSGVFRFPAVWFSFRTNQCGPETEPL